MADIDGHLRYENEAHAFQAAHGDAMARGARCDLCPLQMSGRGPVPSQIEPGAPLLAAAEAPGPSDIRWGWNMSGSSGDTLNDAAALGGVFRSRMTVINTIACCQPEGSTSLEVFLDRDKRRALRDGKDWISPIECCRPRFERDIEDTIYGAPMGANADEPRKVPVLLAIGQFALSAIERWARERDFYSGDDLLISRVHGAPIPLTVPHDDNAATDVEAAQVWGYVIASYHPNFAIPDRGGLKWSRFVKANITRAAQIASRGFVHWSEPSFLLEPSVETAIEWLRTVTAHGRAALDAGRVLEVTTDLETCEPDLDGPRKGKPSIDQHTCAIRTIGVAVKLPNVTSTELESATLATTEHVLVVPFRHMSGDLWEYSDLERAQLADAFRELYDTCAIVGHNIYPFDSAIMLRDVSETLSITFEAALTVGAPTGRAVSVSSLEYPPVTLFPLLSVRERLITDTQTLHHCTPAQDMPHNLSFVGREWFEVPAWKSKEDIQSTDNADDLKLQMRCGRDSLVTDRVVDPMRAWCEQVDTVKQYKTDETIGRILRDMSELGMIVDESVRGYWSRVLTRERDKLQAEWRTMIGRDVNLQSPDQMQDLLYREWGYDPPIVKDGAGGGEWDEEIHDIEDGATSVPAILALLDNGVEKRHAEALEKALECKALSKPLSSYVNNTPLVPWPDGYAYGRVEAEGALPERPRYSWMRPTFTIARTPVGRSTCKRPGEQQRPKQGRKIGLLDAHGRPIIDPATGLQKTETANMRKIVVAAPGHVLVYCDYKQSHVRIYGALSGSERIYDAIAKGIDIHAMNGAVLLSDSEAMLWKTYERILSGKDPSHPLHADYEYWRFVPKKYFFGVAYGAIWETLYETMRSQRQASNGKRAFPTLKPDDCRVWHQRIHHHYPEMARWQQTELLAYAARSYAMSPVFDERKRFGPLEANMIPNHAVLAFEGSNKNNAMMEIDRKIPFRVWSRWTGLVLDYHDALVVQVPEVRADDTVRIVEGSMASSYRGMQFGGDAKIVRSLGDA